MDREQLFNEFRNLTRDEQVQLVDRFREYMAHQARSGLYPGLRVKFTDRGGQTLTGTVTKVNHKSVKVAIPRPGQPDAMWAVSPGLLTPA